METASLCPLSLTLTLSLPPPTLPVSLSSFISVSLSVSVSLLRSFSGCLPSHPSHSNIVRNPKHVGRSRGLTPAGCSIGHQTHDGWGRDEPCPRSLAHVTRVFGKTNIFVAVGHRVLSWCLTQPGELEQIWWLKVGVCRTRWKHVATTSRRGRKRQHEAS